MLAVSRCLNETGAENQIVRCTASDTLVGLLIAFRDTPASVFVSLFITSEAALCGPATYVRDAATAARLPDIRCSGKIWDLAN